VLDHIGHLTMCIGRNRTMCLHFESIDLRMNHSCYHIRAIQMNNNKFYIATAIGLLLMAVFASLINAGVFKTIEPLNLDMCIEVEGVVGAEDITFIPGTNKALVSSYDRRIEVEDPSQEIAGAIYIYDLDEKVFTKVSPDLIDFKPHGISLYELPNGALRLFVVDHAHEKHQIQIFDFKNETLSLVRSVESEEFISPNDIHAVGPEQFYVTNDHGFVTGIMRLMEDYLMLPLSNLVFFDGESAKEVAAGMAYANGVQTNKSGNRLYLASVTSLTLNIYERNTVTNDLYLLTSINTGTGVDNIELDEKGDLWLGAHPQLLKFVSHAKNIDKRSPSEIIKIKVSDGSYDVVPVYRNTGDPISGVSVAAVKGDRMLVGSVFDEKILDCELPKL
jgi:arylesterase/paraoxonase